jgi:PAS domain-containing protein
VEESTREKTVEVAAQIVNGYDFTNFENIYVHKDGRHIPILWSATWDEDEQVMYCIAKDATALKATQLELLSSERKLSSVTKKSADMLGIIDEHGTYMYVSDNVEKLMGYRPEQLVGTNALTLIHPEDLDQVMAELSDLLSSQEQGSLRFALKMAITTGV